MKVREMDKLTAHFDRYFEQENEHVLHPIVDNGFHVDVLIYEPTKKYPFWKLVTMGASDYKMPKIPNTIGNRNEYIMFIDADEDLHDKSIMSWYHAKLTMIATYAKFYNTHVTYSHSFGWENEDPEDEMIGAFIEFPQVIENADVLRCQTGAFKTVACLQVVLLTKEDLERLTKIGRQAFSEYLYPERGGKCHFISERRRSEKF